MRLRGSPSPEKPAWDAKPKAKSSPREQRLRVPDHLGEDLAAQGLQKGPELPHPSMKRGRVQPHYSREQMREESLGIPQKRALRLHAPQLLEEHKRDDFRVREAFEGFVASSAIGVEVGVSVVYEAEEEGQSLFRLGEAWGMVGVGHLLLLREGRL